MSDPSLPNPKPKNKKKRKNLISLSLSVCVCRCVSFLSSFLIYDSFSLSLSVCVYVCVSVSFLLFWSVTLSLSLSLSLCGKINERGCDDGFVDVKSVEVSGIAEKGPFFGLKPSRFGFYFLIFPVWLLRKWGRIVHFLVWNPLDLAFIFLSFLFGYWENEGEGSVFWFETQ